MPSIDRRWCSALVVALLMAASCSGEQPPEEPAPAAPARSSIDDSTTAPSSEDAGEEETTTTVDPADATTDESPGPDDDEIEAIWVELWAAATSVGADRDTAFAELGASINPAVEAELTDRIPGDIERVVANNPVLSDGDNGSVRIDDCLNVDPSFTEENASWWSATAVAGDDGRWVIQDLMLETGEGCVPAAVAEEAIAAYLEFWESRADYWNPADPDHPAIERTVTGGELERIVALLTEDREKGWYVVIDEETYDPYVAIYENATTVLVVDCIVVPPSTGVFDADGNRLDEIAEPVPGQRDFAELLLVRADGRWKVDNVFRVENTDCIELDVPVV